MASKSRHNSVSSRQLGPRLGAIDEDGDMHPDVEEQPTTPPKAYTKTIRGLLPFEFPPRASHDRAPPPYSEWDGVKGPGGENFADLRDNRNVRRRGGSRRLLLLLLVFVTLTIVGLVAGLVIGLRKEHYDHSTPSSPAPTNTTQPFPAGSYSFTTFLTTPSTSCTSNPATWQCYPYVTYNESTTSSVATFNWIISPSASGYQVSSTENPFAITFSNASLSLINWGLKDEAYTFSISLDKTVIPTTALTSDGSSSECKYNATTFTGTLYTKMASTYPPPSSTKPSGASFNAWPYAVKISQSIGGGMSVPDCYKTDNGRMGDRITIQTEEASEVCSCDWQDYGT